MSTRLPFSFLLISLFLIGIGSRGIIILLIFTQESSQWLGKYQISAENSTCSSVLCSCCPTTNSFLQIDINTATRKDFSFLMRGQVSGYFCDHEFIGTIDLTDATKKESFLKLFDKDFRLTLTNDGINFECIDSGRCSFFASRVVDSFALYDSVINIDSLLSLSQSGWDIWFKDRADFERKSKKDTIVIGVAGLYNKGKTWIINEVSSKNFSAGFHVHTAGLSIKYSEYENKAASYLDTAGFETPITFYNEDSKEHFQNMTTEEITDVHQLKIKDRHVTEHFIQNFIFENSDIIIIVVGHLTFSDQKLINRILNQYGKEKKEIFVLHNYFEIRETKHVMELIDRDIKGAFDVKVAPLDISKELASKGYFHQEIYLNKNYPHVRHLVTAAKGSTAGTYFNEPVFDFLRALIQSKSPTENFDILAKLNKYVRDNVGKYADLDDKEYKIIQEDKKGSLRMVCKMDGKLKLKPISFDVNGALIKLHGYEYHADFDFVMKGEKLIFKVDLAGLKKDEKGKRIISYKWDRMEKSCFNFEAELDEDMLIDRGDLIVSKNRRRGKVKVTPPCLDSQFDVIDTHEDVSFNDGVLTLIFKVTKKIDKKVSVEL